jgi:hypothetical protein
MALMLLYIYSFIYIYIVLYIYLLKKFKLFKLSCNSSYRAIAVSAVVQGAALSSHANGATPSARNLLKKGPTRRPNSQLERPSGPFFIFVFSPIDGLLA